MSENASFWSMSADQASAVMGIISHHTAAGFQGWKTFYKSPFLQTKHRTLQAGTSFLVKTLSVFKITWLAFGPSWHSYLGFIITQCFQFTWI